MTDESDSMPLADSDLTAEERRALRRMIRDGERASWALRKLRWLVPMVVAIVVAFANAWDWWGAHFTVKPRA